MKPNQTYAAVGVIATFCALLTGCGGGGGGNNNGGGGSSQSGRLVIGKVVDVSGNPVPGATVQVQGGGPQATTLSQGGFRLDGVGSGVRRLTASVNSNGVNYTGSTQALVLENADVSNANIQVSPTNQQAAITGTVRDQSGRPLRDARVFLAVFVSAGSDTSDGSLASLVAFADDQGVYRLNNVPAGVSRYTATASLQGYQNLKQFINNIQPGDVYRQDFTLGGSVGQIGVVPTNAQVFSFTQPSNGQRPFALTPASATAGSPTSAYAQIRRVLSPAYARRLAAGHVAQAQRKAQASGSFGAYAIQMDLFFDNNQPDSISGFRVYNSEGNAVLTPYDFLQDPLADVYTDLDPFYVTNQQYNFAVSAITTDGAETGLSNTTSVVPLDRLTLAQPSNGQTIGNPVTVAWNRINGASSYVVFLYNAFPSVDVDYSQYSAPGGASSLTLPGLNSGDYYVVVAAVTSDGSAVSVTPITKFRVP